MPTITDTHIALTFIAILLLLLLSQYGRTVFIVESRGLKL
jgi:hypothetical protein